MIIQKNTGLAPGTFARLGVGIFLLIVGMILMAISESIISGIILVTGLVLSISYGAQPLVWWWGADLWIDEEGVHFGIAQERRKPAQVSFQARNKYFVPWSAIQQARVITDHQVVKEMSKKEARLGMSPGQPSKYIGYLPVKGRPALALSIDENMVHQPQIKPPRSWQNLTMTPARVWVFPARDIAAVQEAFSVRGIELQISARPIDPYGF